MKLIQYWISLALNSFSLFRFGHRKNFRMLLGLTFSHIDSYLDQILCWVVKRTRAHQKLHLIALGIIIILDSGKVWMWIQQWKMTRADDQDGEQSTQATFFHPLQRRIDQHQWGWSRWSRIIETKKNTCCTCLTPLQTGHPSLLACHPNSYLDVHEEISKSVSQRSKVVFLSLTYLNTGPDVRPPISSWLQVYKASPTIFSRLKNLLEAFCSPLKLHSE